MKIWKSFLPDDLSLKCLSTIEPGPYFVDRDRNPMWGSLYVPQEDGQCLMLAWDYFDVEFKFEVYGLSIKQLATAPEGLDRAGAILPFSQVAFLLKTEWTRPAKPSEVPEGFEKVLEESGPLAQIPETAISAGTALHGVIFSNLADGKALLIGVDDTDNYSLKATADAEEISAMAMVCDSFTLPEILGWKPPA
ncbi:MAG: hypothetical protein WBG81_05790 [Rhodanobacter sp.]|jgi:hypothetical protein|uniref:hypothetical protein n=1 Tax=Rhodanobacter sp. KK11 TaxID=3083255 RepID=UPI002965D14E|nr:hypothetical protein [Rhodanobacter sp. KK11]MDW2980828.1 hypothetical protein [Rhodanobacter sp. KK11]